MKGTVRFHDREDDHSKLWFVNQSGNYACAPTAVLSVYLVRRVSIIYFTFVRMNYAAVNEGARFFKWPSNLTSAQRQPSVFARRRSQYIVTISPPNMDCYGPTDTRGATSGLRFNTLYDTMPPPIPTNKVLRTRALNPKSVPYSVSSITNVPSETRCRPTRLET